MARSSVFAALLLATAIRGETLFVAGRAPDTGIERVLAVNPNTGFSKSLWDGGYDLDFAISSGAHRAYVAFDDQVAVLDTETGSVLRTFDFPNRLHWTIAMKPTMALSADGRWLYVAGHLFSEHLEEQFVRAIDTEKMAVLPERASLGECPGLQFVPLRADRELLVVCGCDGLVHRLRLTDAGGTASDALLQMPPPPKKPWPGPRVVRSDGGNSVADAAVDDAGSRLFLVTVDGTFMTLDLGSSAVIEEHRKAFGPDLKVVSGEPGLRDGMLWYLPRRPSREYGEGIPQLAVMDAGTFAARRVITPPRPFWTFALSPGGERLYFAEPHTTALRVVDARTGEQIGDIRLPIVPRFMSAIR